MEIMVDKKELELLISILESQLKDTQIDDKLRNQMIELKIKCQDRLKLLERLNKLYKDYKRGTDKNE